MVKIDYANGYVDTTPGPEHWDKTYVMRGKILAIGPCTEDRFLFSGTLEDNEIAVQVWLDDKRNLHQIRIFRRHAFEGLKN